MKKSKIFGFTHRYPQSFLDALAKATGTKWTKCSANTMPQEQIEVRPMVPPTDKLIYCEFKYTKDVSNN